jgi:hypothetical protein
MASETSGRIIFAAFGGIIIPAAYFGLLTFFAIVHKVYASFAFKLPILWAGSLYNYFFPDTDDFIMFSEFRYEVILSNFVGNFLLYSFLTYVVLWWRDKNLMTKNS